MNRVNRVHRTNFAAALVLVLAGRAVLAQSPAAAGPTATAAAPTAAPAARAADIRDIRGPKPVGGDWTLPLVCLAGLLLGGAAYTSYAWSRRRTHVLRSPADIALARLAAAQPLIDAMAGREFSIEVSGIVRDYIENQFQLRAAHRTTDEFLHDLLDPSQRALVAHRANLAEFLETCDLAKFGGWNLSTADMETLRAGAFRFITESATATAADSGAADSSVTRPATTASKSYAAFPST